MSPEKSTFSASNKESIEESKTEKPKKTYKNTSGKPFLQETLRKAGFALLFFLIGALEVGIALYLPARSSLLKAQEELDRLIPMESEYLVLKEGYETFSTQVNVYKILSNLNLLRVALTENETNRINQYINYIEEDLSSLEVPNYPDLPASFIGQFKKVSAVSTSDPQKALDNLQEFHNDLVLLIDNLE